MPTDAKQVVRRYLDAFASGDMETVRDSFAFDATWTIYADLPHLPADGVWKGRDQIVDDFLSHWGPLLFQPGSVAVEVPTLIGEGDIVAVEWRITARTAKGGDYENAYCGVFLVRDGKIQAIREYLDSGYAAQALFT
jgi:uncharacterized protein